MITDVTISPDLSYASVFIRSIAPVNTDEQVELLNQNKGKFRYRIGKSIRLRIVPDIIFKSDVQFEESKAMDDLLNNPKVQADVKKYAQD
jgi:ribosome-binding factor A